MNASAAVTASETVRNRRFKRVPASETLLITWQCPSVREASQGVGLNQGGVFLETQQPQPVGTTLKLKVPNPGGDIGLSGIVRDSIEGKGMGVEFSNIGNKERAKLDLLVKRRLLAAEAARKDADSAAGQPATSAARTAGKAGAGASGQAAVQGKASAASTKAAAAPATAPARERPGPKGRRFPRINLPRGMKVAWQSGQNKEITVVGTVGLGGLFITSAQPPPVGSKLRLLFDVPGGEVLATALVRDSIPGRGMGVEFVEISPESRARIEELLDRLMS
jgi:hypothetical protein